MSNSQHRFSLGSGIAGSTTHLKIASLFSLLLSLMGYFTQFLHPRQVRSFWLLVGLSIAITIGTSAFVH